MRRSKDLTKVQTLAQVAFLLFPKQRQKGAFKEGDKITLEKTSDKKWTIRVERA